MYLYCRKIEAQVLNCLALLSKHNNFAFIISVLALRLIKFHVYYNFLNLNNNTTTTTTTTNNNNYMYMFNKRYSFL